MIKIVTIQSCHLGLVTRNGELVRVLEPGRHTILGFHRLDVVNCLESQWSPEDLERQVRFAPLAAHLHVVDLHDHQRALVWREGRLHALLGPGIHAFWRSPCVIRFEVLEIQDLRFEHREMDTILLLHDARYHLEDIHVQAHQNVLMFRDGSLMERLEAGRHVFWKTGADLRQVVVELREQYLDIQGQEIMSSDKVSLRVNMSVAYRVADPVMAHAEAEDPARALYREAQLVLRAAVGTRTLDELLADKESIAGEVRDGLQVSAARLGLALNTVGVRDIILPGDMKELLNQVTEAQKASEANIIRRREETAAARSQANTARLYQDNPALLRMRELEAIQDIMKNAQTTFHMGQGALLDQLRSLLRVDP